MWSKIKNEGDLIEVHLEEGLSEEDECDKIQKEHFFLNDFYYPRRRDQNRQ